MCAAGRAGLVSSGEVLWAPGALPCLQPLSPCHSCHPAIPAILPSLSPFHPCHPCHPCHSCHPSIPSTPAIPATPAILLVTHSWSWRTKPQHRSKARLWYLSSSVIHALSLAARDSQEAAHEECQHLMSPGPPPLRRCLLVRSCWRSQGTIGVLFL